MVWNCQSSWPREHVVGADVAGRRHGCFARLAAEDHDVAPDAARARRHRARARAFGARQADPHVDDAVVAERHDRLAGARVDLLEEAVDREDQAAILAVSALPVVDALARDAVQPLVHPDLLAGRRVERDERRRVAAEAVEHAVGEHRTEGRRGVRIEPRHLEPGDVGLVDLIERVVIGAVDSGQRLDRALRGRRAEPDGSHETGGQRDRRHAAAASDQRVTRVHGREYAGPYVAGTVTWRRRAGQGRFSKIESLFRLSGRPSAGGVAQTQQENGRRGES